MGFSPKQVGALQRKLDSAYVRSREFQGRTLSYIEGWHAIAEANRIFGHDGWDRETVEGRCVLDRDNDGGFQAVYVAKVRITVRAGGLSVLREGYGTGEAHGTTAGATHEKALKTAETDATKRALATFGKPFGLSLYVSPRNNRGHGISNPLPGAPPLPDDARRRTQQRIGRYGRYFVPPRAKVVLDPALTAVGSNASVSDDSAGEPVSGRRVSADPVLGDAGQSAALPAEAESRADQAGTVQGDRGALIASIKQTAPEAPVAHSADVASTPTPESHTETTLPGKPSLDTGASEKPLAADERAGSNAPGETAEAEPASALLGSPSLQPPAPTLTDEFHGPRLMIDWPKRQREPEHLKHVRTQPCLICSRTPSDAHHLRFAQSRGIGLKVSDEFTVPLCRVHHDQLHQSGHEVDWWSAMDRDVDPLAIARTLWEESQARIAAERKAEKARSGLPAK